MRSTPLALDRLSLKYGAPCDASLDAQAVASDPVNLVWGPEEDRFKYRSTECIVVEDDLRVLCDSVGGTGSAHSLVLTVAGQQSDAGWNVSYMAPVLTRVSGSGFLHSPTQGGAELIVNGRFLRTREQCAHFSGILRHGVATV